MAEEAKRKGTQVIFDYSYKGGLDSQGRIDEMWQEEALKNSVRLWIGSFAGDIIGQPNRGGQVMKYLLRPMSQVSIKQFDGALRKSFSEEFGGFAKIQSLQVTPMEEERMWKINMSITSYPLKLITEIEDYLKGR